MKASEALEIANKYRQSKENLYNLLINQIQQTAAKGHFFINRNLSSSEEKIVSELKDVFEKDGYKVEAFYPTNGGCKLTIKWN